MTNSTNQPDVRPSEPSETEGGLLDPITYPITSPLSDPMVGPRTPARAAPSEPEDDILPLADPDQVHQPIVEDPSGTARRGDSSGSAYIYPPVPFN